MDGSVLASHSSVQLLGKVTLDVLHTGSYINGQMHPSLGTVVVRVGGRRWHLPLCKILSDELPLLAHLNMHLLPYVLWSLPQTGLYSCVHIHEGASVGGGNVVHLLHRRPAANVSSTPRTPRQSNTNKVLIDFDQMPINWRIFFFSLRKYSLKNTNSTTTDLIIAGHIVFYMKILVSIRRHSNLNRVGVSLNLNMHEGHF